MENLTYADDGPLLQSGISDLYATPSAQLPFDNTIVVRSFLVQRSAGDLLIYNSPGITASAEAIKAIAAPERLLITHWHEAMYGPPGLSVPIFVHEKDRAQTSLPVAGTFGERMRLADDLEIIPTPGHTAGAAMFLWDNGEHRFLFSGDTVLVKDGRWRAVVLGESDRQAYLESLSPDGRRF